MRMTRADLIYELGQMAEVYPRLNTRDGVVPFWFELAKNYTRDEWRQAFRRYVLSHDTAPGIGSMRDQLDSIFGSRGVERTRNKYAQVPYKRIDLAMDVFSPEEVKEELKKCHPKVKSGMWSDLVSSNDWVTHYRACEDRMTTLALGKVHREGPPPRRFWKHELYERPWDLIGEPRFDSAGICTNRIDYSGEFYRELRESNEQ